MKAQALSLSAGAWNKTERNILPAVALGRERAAETLNLTQQILEERLAASAARLPPGLTRDALRARVPAISGFLV